MRARLPDRVLVQGVRHLSVLHHQAHEFCRRSSGQCRHPARAGAPVGAVVFIQRFGSLLNAHTHLHLLVLDGLCQDNPKGGVRFMPVDPIDQDAVLGVQQTLRTRLLAYAVGDGRILTRGDD
ncbi:MAG: hypothetical protein FJY37_12920 [Betaproteobacteria bacterium]|nr:hypothetical protein [Betaproteobacteria bacterium]